MFWNEYTQTHRECTHKANIAMNMNIVHLQSNEFIKHFFSFADVLCFFHVLYFFLSFNSVFIWCSFGTIFSAHRIGAYVCSLGVHHLQDFIHLFNSFLFSIFLFYFSIFSFVVWICPSVSSFSLHLCPSLYLFFFLSLFVQNFCFIFEFFFFIILLSETHALRFAISFSLNSFYMYVVLSSVVRVHSVNELHFVLFHSKLYFFGCF